jgi:putative transposase
MARKPRIHYPGAFYHVILRGNNKQQIFFSNQDREYFYSLLQEGVSRFNYRIHAFCLMTNHVHLLLQVGIIPLSKVIHNLCFRYSKNINKLQSKVGHLFQGRYKAILVDTDSYLLELVRYIHLNPVRAKMVGNPESYYWNSHRAYIKIDKTSWLTKNFVLGCFDQSEDTAITKYLDFMCEKIPGVLDPAIGTQQKYDILGDDNFLQNLDIGCDTKKYHIALEEVIRIVCAYYSVSETNLAERSRSRVNTRLRAVIGWLVREFDIYTLSHVSKFFNRDITGLIRSIRNIESVSTIKQELIEIKELVKKSICQA